MTINVERAVQNMRNMIGTYALDKGHMKIDNFCRVYYGTYINNVHGMPEPYYLLVGTIMPNNNGGELVLTKELAVKPDVWAEVEPIVATMLASKTTA